MTNETLDNVENQESTIDHEALASEMGWTPKDKFRGDPTKWVDAKTFYEKAEHVLPIVKKQRDEARKAEAAMKAEIQAIKADNEQVKKDAKEAIKFMHDGLDREYKVKEAALKAEKAEAISAGDGAKAMQIDEALETLKAEKSQAKEEAKKEVTLDTPQIHPDWKKWVADNSWFNDDKRLNRLAKTIGFDMAEDDSSLEGTKLWDAVKSELMAMYPEKFPEERERPGAQRGGKTTGPQTKAKTYENLPDDAKAKCDKYVKNGWSKNREQYCKFYYEQEGV